MAEDVARRSDAGGTLAATSGGSEGTATAAYTCAANVGRESILYMSGQCRVEFHGGCHSVDCTCNCHNEKAWKDIEATFA